jgi:hypothetical protein
VRLKFCNKRPLWVIHVYVADNRVKVAFNMATKANFNLLCFCLYANRLQVFDDRLFLKLAPPEYPHSPAAMILRNGFPE